MPLSPPSRPLGQTPEARFQQWVWDQLSGPGQLISGPGVQINQTTRGKMIYVKAGTVAAPVGATVKAFHFSKSLGDYFLTSEGTAVAKPYKLRCSIGSEVIYGVTVGFSYPHNPALGGPSADALAYLYRKAAIPSAGLSENQGVVPQYLANDIVYAVQMTDTGVMSDPKDLVTSVGGTSVKITWLQIATAQAWTKFSDQTFGT